MNFPHLPPRKLLCAFAILNAVMTVLPVRGEPIANREPAGNKTLEEVGKEATPLNKRERKALKRERQREKMLQRIEQRAQGGSQKKSVPPPTAPNHPNPYQFTEDFDR